MTRDEELDSVRGKLALRSCIHDKVHMVSVDDAILVLKEELDQMREAFNQACAQRDRVIKERKELMAKFKAVVEEHKSCPDKYAM